MNKHTLNRQQFEAVSFIVTDDGIEPMSHDYPKSTSQAIVELQLRGLNAGLALLERLARSGEVKPESPNQWTRDDIDAAAYHLKRAGIWTPHSVMLWYSNIDAIDWLAALRRESERCHKYIGALVADWRFWFKVIVTPHEKRDRGSYVDFHLRGDWESKLEEEERQKAEVEA